MKKLIVRKIDFRGVINMEIAEKLLEKNTKSQSINSINWLSFNYNPEVRFRIAYFEDQIWLKFYVAEDSIRAKEINVNGAVCKDSCVEFFISTNEVGSYYNFEFNCIGVYHVGYNSKYERLLIDTEVLKNLKVKTTLGNQSFEEKVGGYHWELMAIIPIVCFTYDIGLDLNGLNATANFYKCGDETSTPHYVTWNPVETIVPDFHQPNFFGELLFEK